MNLVLKLFIFFLIFGCSKPKTVLICGDHVCVNELEAEQFFEENLIIEVKVINKKKRELPDLVELNLKKNQTGKREINLISKNKTVKKLRDLSGKEKREIINQVKNKKKIIKTAKKTSNKNEIINKKRGSNLKEKITEKDNNQTFIKNSARIRENNVVDVCKILKKCDIKEISDFILDQGKNKDFPDITLRQ